MKVLVLVAMLVTSSAFAGEFFCRHESKPFLRAVESAAGLQVTAYGEFATDFGDTTHPFHYAFNAQRSTGAYQSYTEGNEHHIWIYQLRLGKNPAKTFKAWLNVAHDEQGPSHSFELDCARGLSPLAHTVSGVVSEVFCGEIHPFAVGDACVVYVQDGDQLMGLVSDFDASEELEALKGKRVSVPSSALMAVSKAEADVLREDMNATAWHVRLDTPASINVR